MISVIVVLSILATTFVFVALRSKRLDDDVFEPINKDEKSN